MLSLNKWLPLATTLGAAILPASTSTADEVPTSSIIASGTQDSCLVHYRQKTHERYVRAIYRRDRVSMDARRKAGRMRACANSLKATQNMRGVLHQAVEERKMRRQIEAITSYSCSFGRSSIPCRVVYCESKGDWGAYNSSGAAGIYQIMVIHGRPWPANTDAKKLVHHRIAARLWRGGRGASNWQQCL